MKHYSRRIKLVQAKVNTEIAEGADTNAPPNDEAQAALICDEPFTVAQDSLFSPPLLRLSF